MKITVVLYLEDGIEDDDLKFCDTYIPQSLTDRLLSLKKIDSIIYSVPGDFQGEVNSYDNVYPREGKDDVDFWKAMFKRLEADHLVKIYMDAPFIDPVIIDEMLEAHTEYLAEFTYSENVPDGLGCEIISFDLIKEIPDLDEKTLPLSSVIKSNINQFDIELYYKEPDIRDKRISFRNSVKRDAKIMTNLYNLDDRVPEYGDIRKKIEDNPGVLYIAPSYLELELSGACDLDCVFCYRKKVQEQHGDMSFELFKKIMSDMDIFNLPYTLCFGGSGEPLMNKNFYRIFEHAIMQEQLTRIILETNGIYLDSNFINSMNNFDLSKAILIINLNGADEATYRTLHGADYYTVVSNNIQDLIKSGQFTGNIYIQVMKINETEEFLDKFYTMWESQAVRIILQKHNTYLGLLDDRRYSDLTPLDRVPCWHLQRDLYILSDGRVPFCKQDFDGRSLSGSVADSSVSDIFDKRKDMFIRDYNRDYPQKPDCASCDEWYTYNF